MAAMSVIGIDFGNESCYVAVARAGGIETIANDYSLRATPSCVAFSDQNRILGVAAKNQMVTNMKNTIYGFKRLLGRKYNDPHVQNELKHLTYQIVQQTDNSIGILVEYLGENKVFSPEQITAMLFTKLKDVSEQALKTKVNDCVISVPSHYTNAERKSLLEAAQIAGLNVLRLLNEPTATALAYGIYKQDLPNPEDKPRNVVFVDCGHSTLQVAACAFNKGKLKMLASSCDPYLGGRDIDAIMGEYFAHDFKKRYSIDPKSNPRAYLRLLAEVEKLKKQMSANSTKLPLNIECFMNDIDVHGDMKRDKMEELCADIFKRVEKTLRQCLEDSKLSIDEIYGVEIVGGGTRVPAIKQLIEHVFCKTASTTLNQDEAVARGCALQCALLSPAVRVREFNVTDLQNYSVKMVWDPSAGDNGELEVFPRFHAMPFSKMLSFFRKEPFSMKAYYNCSIPYPDKYIGEYTVKDIKPSPEGESIKVKVKVRVNLNGMVGVVGATMSEKVREGGEEEENQNATTPNNGDAKAAADSNESMETENQQQNAQENGETESGEKNEGDKKEGKKKKPGYKTVDLPIEERSCGYSISQLNDFIEAECEMIAADRREKERADARNALEEYVYDLRSKLMDDLEPFVLPSDKDTFVNNLDGMENWLYEEGENCNRQTYADKLASLKEIGEPIKRRKIEFETRAVALEELSHCIQLSHKVVDMYKKGDEKYNHIPPEEVTKVEEAIHNAAKWLEEKRAILQSTPKPDDAAITTEQIRTERKILENLVSINMNKPKPAPPQPAADSKQEPPKSGDQPPSSDSKGQAQENMDVE